jgi:hypothetical protein
VLSFKSGKGTFAQSLAGNTTCPRSIEVAPLLFSHEQWQQCLQSSINDNNLCSRSTALIVVQSLHIFQGHIITASFLFLLHWPFFQTSLLWTPFRSSSIGCCYEKNKSRHWRSRIPTIGVCLVHCQWGIKDETKRFSDSSVSLPVETTHDSTRRQWWCCMFLCATKIAWLLESFYQSTNNHNNIGKIDMMLWGLSKDLNKLWRGEWLKILPIILKQ